MKGLKLSGIMRSVTFAMKKHSPEILTGIGIAGMITTAVMAVRATPKALELINEREAQMDEEELTYTELTKVEKVKAVWRCYIPAAITGVLSTVCLIGASSVNLRRNAALATAYTLSETALREYSEKAVEVIGEKKEKAIRDAVAKDKIEKNPVGKNEIIVTGKGDYLCYDAVAGRYFTSDIDKLRKIENELNRRMRDEMFISLNDFYYEIGREGTKLGETLGWSIDDGYIDFDFSSQLAEGGTPCLVVDYKIAPKYTRW